MVKMCSISDEYCESLIRQISNEGSNLRKSKVKYENLRIENLKFIKDIFDKFTYVFSKIKIESDNYYFDKYKHKGIKIIFDYDKQNNKAICYCSYSYYIIGGEKNEKYREYLIEDLEKECFVGLCNNLDFFCESLLSKIQEKMQELKILDTLTEVF